jgi:hypothetical protein
MSLISHQCTEPMIPGVMVTCFDNLTMNVAYKSFSVGGETGEKLDMTNWFAVRVPRALAPSMDGARLFRQGIFRSGVSLSEFCRLFYLDNAEIVGNKKRRWFRFLRAEASGRLLERPNVPPLWQPHKLYQPQMPDRLQSGYEDVEHELVVMTKYAREHGACVLFVAGDGLALMRLNHLLKNKPDMYIDTSPVVIPIQGKSFPAHPTESFWNFIAPFCARAPHN